jgi:hypothetical protein
MTNRMGTRTDQVEKYKDLSVLHKPAKLATMFYSRIAPLSTP